MDAEWSVEAGLDDPVIVVPWSGMSSEGSTSAPLAYIDIKANNKVIDEIEEARSWPEVRHALLTLNATASDVWTSKCHAWVLDDDEKQLDFGPMTFGFGMYIDVLSSSRTKFASLEELRTSVETWTKTLTSCEPAEARVDLVVRPASWHGEAGYAVTVYVFGYGEQEADARRNWSQAATAVAGLIAGNTARAQTIQ